MTRFLQIPGQILFGTVLNAVSTNGGTSFMDITVTTGASNGKLGIFSAWVRLDAGGDGNDMIIWRGQSGSSVNDTILPTNGTPPAGSADDMVMVFRAANNTFRFFMREQVAGLPIALDMASRTAYTGSATTWHHILASWDTANSAAHMYIDGVEDRAVSITIANRNIAYFNASDVTSIYAKVINDTVFTYEGCVAELYFNQAEFLDLSVASNRALFRDAAGCPVDLGGDGSTPTGTAPYAYFKDPAATYLTNSGSGPDAVLNGLAVAFTNCSTTPND